MAYTALIIAILALWVSCTALYLLSRDHTALVKSVINSLEEPDGSHLGDDSTLSGDEITLASQSIVADDLAEELEAITNSDEYEWNIEKKAIDEGKAVEWS